VHIDGGGIDGAVPQEGLEGQQVHAVLVAVRGKSVPEGMGSEPPVNAQQVALLQDAVLDPLLVHGGVKGALLREQPEPGAHARREGTPVGKDQGLQGGGKGDEAVLAVLGVGDMHLPRLQVDVLALQVAELVQAQAGGIEDGYGKPHLQVAEGSDEGAYKLP